MSVVNGMVPWLKYIREELETNEKELNEQARALGKGSVRFGEALRIVNQQIASAEKKYTIAFVGEFNSGKSTIINSYLGLTGDRRLSCNDSPDTAISTRIMYKGEMDCEAEIVYMPGTYENEKVDWVTAKKLTSQVAIEENPELKDKVKNIDEIRYYLDEDILNTYNILDLPGTGTGNHREHTKLTNEKISEADLVFWVVSTSSEPDKNAVANLEKISAKIIPLINVWEFGKDGISGDITPEELRDYIYEKYSIYFCAEEEPVIYYGKEIDYAQENGLDVDEKWGKARLIDCLYKNAFSDDLDLDKEKIRRIEKNVKSELKKIIKELQNKKEELDAMIVETDELKSEADVMHSKLRKEKMYVNERIKDLAKESALRITDHISDEMESFIDDKMDQTSLKKLIRSMGKASRKQQEEELKDLFSTHYLKMNENGECDWLDSMLNEFNEDINIVVEGEYASFAIDEIKKVGVQTMSLKIDNGFAQKLVHKNNVAIGKNVFSTALTGGIIVACVLIPGGELVDSLAGLIGGSRLFKMADTLSNMKEGVIKSARCKIEMNRRVYANELKKIGQEIHEMYVEAIMAEYEKTRGEYENRNAELHKMIDRTDGFIAAMNDHMQEDLV